MDDTAKIRVLLVDDQRLMLDGIAVLLGQFADLEVVGTAANGQEAIERARVVVPDVALMDIRMPVMDGIQAIPPLKALHPGCKILMLTTFGDDDYIRAAIRAGAAGYVLKDLPASELAEAVRGVHRGGYYFDAHTGARLPTLLSEPNAPKQPASALPGIDQLSEREHEVLLLVARGYSNREIGEQLFITEGTVKNHLSNIFAALRVTARAQLIALAFHHNLVG